MIFEASDAFRYAAIPRHLNTTSDETDIDRGDKRRRKNAPI